MPVIYLQLLSSRNSIEFLPFVSAKMQRTYGFVVCILVIIMDVTAGILGIQAEIAQNKVYESWNENYVLILFVTVRTFSNSFVFC